MRIAYVGNFVPPFSTENDIKSALEHNGHTVIPCQEERIDWLTLPHEIDECDLFLWTRTPGLDTSDPAVQKRALWSIRDVMPAVGAHLDLFWGLTARNDREQWVREVPYFQDTDLMFSTDGGHEDRWREAGVDHVWMPPAVARKHTETVGVVDRQWRAQVAFVGSWKDYHPEWTHRKHLVEMTASHYRQRFRAWQGHVRGQDLANLYTTVPVLLGDSCMLDGFYFSDRIPETLGRGGFLIHPDTEGLRDLYPEGTLVTWPLGDFKELFYLIDYYLQHGEERDAIAQAGKQHAIAHHTYELRMTQMFGHLEDRGLL